MIKGQTVKLHAYKVIGTDLFGGIVKEDMGVVDVPNVLIEPASNDAIVTDLQLQGKKLTYILHIPKTDENMWEDTTVEFYGKKWKTYGSMLIYDEKLTPGEWNKKVKVEYYE